MVSFNDLINMQNNGGERSKICYMYVLGDSINFQALHKSRNGNIMEGVNCSKHIVHIYRIMP
jgi:hypothetical protein